MIAASCRILRAILDRIDPPQPSSVRLADVFAEREKLRQERNRARDLAEEQNGVARAALSRAEKAEASRAAEFDAAERYIAERDGLQGRLDQLVDECRFWMAETDRLNRLLAAQGAARLGGIDLPEDIVVLDRFRQRQRGSVSLPFAGPII